ncbi:hypothetical protein IWQ61_000113 [Dispira simplex]|nr:hypothetical protein IWQ61_000113 [Dispira simplex]
MVRTKFRYLLFELQFFSAEDNDHPTDGVKDQDPLTNLNPNFVPLQSSHVFHHVNDAATEIFGDAASAEMLVGFLGTMVKCQRQAIELSRQTILRWNQSREKSIPLPLMKNTLERLEEDIQGATSKV